MINIIKKFFGGLSSFFTAMTPNKNVTITDNKIDNHHSVESENTITNVAENSDNCNNSQHFNNCKFEKVEKVYHISPKEKTSDDTGFSLFFVVGIVVLGIYIFTIVCNYWWIYIVAWIILSLALFTYQFKGDKSNALVYSLKNIINLLHCCGQAFL